MAWIGVDFDGTLATYESGQGPLPGKPIMPMVHRVRHWLAEGFEVRILTARVSTRNTADMIRPGESLWATDIQRSVVQDWCQEHLGQRLQVTAEKDFEMAELWDDRAVSVEPNTGRLMSPHARF